MENNSEAKRVFEISLDKLEDLRESRVSKSLHKNVLVNSVFNKVCGIVSESELLCEETTTTFTESTKMELDANRASPAEFFVPEDSSDMEKSVKPQIDPDLLSQDLSAFSASVASILPRGVKRSPDSSLQFTDNKRARPEQEIASVTRWRSSDNHDDDSDLITEFGSSSSSSDRSDESVADENVKENSHESPMEVQQMTGLISVFSSCFTGLGDYEANSKSPPDPFQEYQNSPIRRANSLPELTIDVPKKERKRKVHLRV